jgi:hypothetical protein
VRGVQGPGQAFLDLDAEREVVAGFGERGGEDLGGHVEALAVAAHPAEARQRRRAPRRRPPRGLVQRGGDLGVGRRGGEREVPGALLRVIGDPGEAAV